MCGIYRLLVLFWVNLRVPARDSNSGKFFRVRARDSNSGKFFRVRARDSNSGKFFPGTGS